MRRILSLSGGGYLGLFTARFLELLEGEKQPLGQRFDLIAGTSVGGLIALALSLGITAKEICGIIQNAGTAIFPFEQSTIFRLFAPGHDSGALANVVDGLFGEKTMSDLKIPVVIPTFCLTSGKVRLFRTPHLRDGLGDGTVRLRDVALATTAAPTYYRPHRINEDDYVDGGLAANAPDTIAVVDALCMRWPVDSVRMLSVGTTRRSVGLAATKIRPWGILSWLRNKLILNTIMAAQTSLARQTSASLLNQTAITVADPRQEREQEDVLRFDRVETIATATLRSLACTEFKRLQVESGLEIEAYQQHTPAVPCFHEN